MTLEELKSVIKYDPITGEITRKIFFSNRGRATSGTTRSDGYRILRIFKKQYYEHRLAFFYMTGRWPRPSVDHINGDTSDNRWENLREATASSNGHNRGPQKNNSLGFKGISKTKNGFECRITLNKKLVFRKSFSTLEAAKVAIKKAFDDILPD